jgi:hypothetical protein
MNLNSLSKLCIKIFGGKEKEEVSGIPTYNRELSEKLNDVAKYLEAEHPNTNIEPIKKLAEAINTKEPSIDHLRVIQNCYSIIMALPNVITQFDHRNTKTSLYKDSYAIPKLEHAAATMLETQHGELSLQSVTSAQILSGSHKTSDADTTPYTEKLFSLAYALKQDKKIRKACPEGIGEMVNRAADAIECIANKIVPTRNELEDLKNLNAINDSISEHTYNINDEEFFEKAQNIRHHDAASHIYLLSASAKNILKKMENSTTQPESDNTAQRGIKGWNIDD